MSDSLASRAAAWKATRNPSTETPKSENQVDEINLKSVLGSDSTSKTRPQRPQTKASKSKSFELPPAIYRKGEATLKRSVDVPLDFENLRIAANKRGMTATHLVLAAATAYGDELRSEAQKKPFLHSRSPSKGWTLMVSSEELAELDQLVEDLTPAFGKKSRTAIVTELLSRCSQ